MISHDIHMTIMSEVPGVQRWVPVTAGSEAKPGTADRWPVTEGDNMLSSHMRWYEAIKDHIYI